MEGGGTPTHPNAFSVQQMIYKVCLPILPPLRCLRFGNLEAWLEPNML